MQEADGVIHLAGGIRAGDSIAETSDEDVSWMMSLNVGSAFNLLRATIPVLAANGGGSIITIGARAVLQPTGNRAAYAASKAALACSRIVEVIPVEINSQAVPLYFHVLPPKEYSSFKVGPVGKLIVGIFFSRYFKTKILSLCLY